MIRYQGYTATVEFDPDEMVMHGRVDGIRDVVTFQAQSVGDLQRQFKAAIDDYLELCREHGEEPEKPYSGRFLVRMDPDLHKEASSAARRAGVSLNGWILEAMTDRLRSNEVRAAAYGYDAKPKKRSRKPKSAEAEK